MAKPAAAVLQAISTTGSNAGLLRPRRSLVPVSTGSRTSIVASAGYQPFALPAVGGLAAIPDENEGEVNRSGSAAFTLTEKEINDRVSLDFGCSCCDC